MTSPARKVDGTCPNCGARVEGWYRPSINLDLGDGESWTEEAIEKATTVACGGCGQRLAPRALIVGINRNRS
jgi:hypothetical protein